MLCIVKLAIASQRPGATRNFHALNSRRLQLGSCRWAGATLGLPGEMSISSCRAADAQGRPGARARLPVVASSSSMSISARLVPPVPGLAVRSGEEVSHRWRYRLLPAEWKHWRAAAPRLAAGVMLRRAAGAEGRGPNMRVMKAWANLPVACRSSTTWVDTAVMQLLCPPAARDAAAR